MDILEYFKKVTKLEPIPEQVEVLKALADVSVRNLCICAGRGFSKSLLCALAAIWFADEYADQIGRPLEILLVSGQKRMYWHLNNFFRNNEFLRKKRMKKGVFDEIPVDGFELTNHSIVDTALGTSASIRSHRADVIFVDEACLIRDEIYRQAILPVSTGDIAKVVLLSTPSTNNFFTEIASDPKKHDYVLKQFSAEVAPWQKLSNERLKKVLAKSEYATEVLGRPPTKAERAFFASKHIKACTTTNLLPEGGMRMAGLDFGQVRGKNLLTIVEKNKSKFKVLFQKHYRKSIEESLGEIAEELRKHKVAIVKADSRPTEYQQIVGKKLAGTPVHYVDARFHKRQLLGQLQHLIQTHNIQWDKDKHVKLILELRKYRRGKSTGDDYVDSLALATYQFPHKTKPQVKVVFC